MFVRIIITWTPRSRVKYSVGLFISKRKVKNLGIHNIGIVIGSSYTVRVKVITVSAYSLVIVTSKVQVITELGKWLR